MEPSRPKLLVVDDDRLVRLNLALTLSREGYAVDVAASACEAMALIDRERYVVVVSDIGLQDGSGFDVLKAAKDAAPTTKVILVTGSRESVDPDEPVVQGAEALLFKPFALAELTEAVRRASCRAADTTRILSGEPAPPPPETSV